MSEASKRINEGAGVVSGRRLKDRLIRTMEDVRVSCGVGEGADVRLCREVHPRECPLWRVKVGGRVVEVVVGRFYSKLVGYPYYRVGCSMYEVMKGRSVRRSMLWMGEGEVAVACWLLNRANGWVVDAKMRDWDYWRGRRKELYSGGEDSWVDRRVDGRILRYIEGDEVGDGRF